MNPVRLGLSATTLVAIRVPEEKIPTVARLINAYPEVSHNYRRDNPYSLWFTIAGKDEHRIREIMDGNQAASRASANRISLNFPPCDRFKIDVRFTFPGIPVNEGSNGPRLIATLLAALEKGLPVTREPFAEIGRRLGYVRNPKCSTG